MKAFVPKRKLDEIWKQSHTAEVRDFAEGYFKKKKFPVLEDRGNEWIVERNGRKKTLNITAIKRIAAKLNHAWEWDS